MIALDAAGHFHDAPWDVSGRLGTLDRLYEFRDVEQDVTGHVGDAKLTLRGRIRDPLALGDPRIEAEVEGPDIAAALATVGLRSPLSGPFRVGGRLSPSSEGVDFDLAGELAGVAAKARGRVHALLDPRAVDASIEMSGPDASLVGEWTGVRGLPPGPFDVAARLRRDGAGLFLDEVKARVGGTAVEVSGKVGAPPRCVGTDLKLTASGSDLSELAELTRLRLPAGSFGARARFLRREDALAVEDVEVRSGDAVFRGGGTIGEPPRLEGLDMNVEASGTDLSRFSHFATVELPSEPFEIRGHVALRDGAFDLEAVDGRLSSNDLSLAGRLVPVPRLAGTDLDVRLAGTDLARAGSLVGLPRLPAEPYQVSGRVRFEPDGYRLDGGEALAGRMAARVEGRLGARPVEGGTELSIRVEGRSLSDLAAWGVSTGLPSDPFTVSGRLRIDDGVFRIDRAAAVVGNDRATLDGTLGSLPDLSSLELAVESSGLRLDDLGRFLRAAGSEPPRRLPAEPYALSGRVLRVPAGVELQDLLAKVGDAEIRLDGVLGTGEKLRGTDLRLDARAPDSSLLAEVAGVTLPAGPTELHGRLAHLDSGFRLDGVTASIGDARVEVSGVLGRPPDLAGTDLDIAVAGPDLAEVLEPVTGLAPLPAEAFEVSAHVEGSVGRLGVSRLAARLGESDLEGSITMRREERSFFDADLRSRHLGISALLAGFAEKPAPADASLEPERRKDRKRGPWVPDEPLRLDLLRSFDADLRLTAAESEVPGLMLLHGVSIEATVRDGAVRVNCAEGRGEHGGRATASLSLEPVADGYRAEVSGRIVEGRIGRSLTAEAAALAPSIDVEYAFEGVGHSLHAIAASGDGHALLTVGPGRIQNQGDFLTSGVLRGLLDALNPFRKSSPFTEAECAVAAAVLEDGKVEIEPIAAQTDKLTVVGRGKVDFETEEIDLVWTLKPRTGVGISPGSITNPYIKLGGTLSEPSLDAKPLQAVASSGAAVATAGLTVLFRGLYDRVTAEKKVCRKALEEARRRSEERRARAGP